MIKSIKNENTIRGRGRKKREEATTVVLFVGTRLALLASSFEDA
jgi:hypothetical protein